MEQIIEVIPEIYKAYNFGQISGKPITIFKIPVVKETKSGQKINSNLDFPSMEKANEYLVKCGL